MNTYKLTIIIALLISCFTAMAAAKSETVTLFPGESYTFQSVTVTWQVESVEQAEPENLQKRYGVLNFQGPTSTISNVELYKFYSPYYVGEEERASLEEIGVYIDDVVFEIEGKFAEKRLLSLTIHAYTQSSKRTFTAAPSGDWDHLYASHVRPLFLSQWKLSISEEPVKYPDGSQYLEITALNMETKEKVTIPTTQGARKTFGRFDIRVKDVCKPTRTAKLGIYVHKDELIRGRDAYVERWEGRKDYPHGATYEEVLNLLGKKYGFEVEWVEFPGYPESIDYAKNLKLEIYSISRKTVKHILETMFGEHKTFPYELALEWKDPTHLRVWAKNYDRVVAEKEDEEREKARKAEEKKRFEEEFKKNYTAETKVYKLSKITPATAKLLIDPELDTYYLITRYGEYKIVPRGRRDDRWTVMKKTEDHSVVDEKANALIVTAIPRTHEKIKNVLAGIDDLLEKKEAQEAPKPYRLEVILLQGGKAGEKVEGTSATFDPKLAKSYGISEEDLQLFGFDAVAELSKGFVTLLPERGEPGRASVALTEAYSCELEFQDVRQPYLVVKGRLLETQTGRAARTLIENTLYLEKDKPSLLGLTNLRQALILVLRLHNSP